jgi:HEAT repeat protein
MKTVAWLGAALAVGQAAPSAAAGSDDDPAAEGAGLDEAMSYLKTFDWGKDLEPLVPLDRAVVDSHSDAAAQGSLEKRLAATLATDIPQRAKDYVCRRLSLIATAQSVPALAPLLADEKLSHMARLALERMPCPEAVGAIRDALPKVEGRVKVGLINSLGVRRDAGSLPALAALLEDPDEQILSAAAAALGAIGNAEAAKALEAFQATAPESLQMAVTDSRLSCAERLLAAGDTARAKAIYARLREKDQPEHVRVAAMRGLLAVAADESSAGRD